MEDMEGPRLFSTVVSLQEWETIPSKVAEKLQIFVNDKFEEFITSKALLETNRFNAEQSLSELNNKFQYTSKENEELKLKFESATNTINELESQISLVTCEVNNMQATCQRLESEAAEYRYQRNAAVDERDDHHKMVERRNAEVERMRAEITSLTERLEAAINSKCEALAQADEVASMKITLEYREKRIDQERTLLNKQIETLSKDLKERTEELIDMRRENTYRCIQLETKLNEKIQELAVATEQVKALMELNNNMTSNNEELSQKIFSQREIESKMNESYMHEIEAKTKLANTYKAMYDESQKHADDLEKALTEVQELLKSATEQYGELETKHKESELAHDEIISKKNEYIAMLNDELEKANEILEASKQENIEKDMEGISPSAVKASRILKSGLSVTQLYSQTETLRIDLANKEEECARLNNYITKILSEIEEKGPLVKKLRHDYSNTLDANDALKAANDAMLNELQQLREQGQEYKRLEAATAREKQRCEKQIADLSRQLVHLLHEIDQARAGSSSTSTDMDLSDSVSSADIITKKLVTFNDISELQSTNQKLLVLVRELTERQEEVENLNPAAIAEMKEKLLNMRESQNDLLEERERQNKMMATLRSQRDMYKNLYNQAVKAACNEIPMQLERPYLISESNGDIEKTNLDIHSDSHSESKDKASELEMEVQKYQKEIKQLKDEMGTYRTEKANNDKILVEQMEKMRDEIKELTRLNCKLSSHAEVNEERFKIMQNNTEIYKKQINALEQQNKIYTESIIRHEQTIVYLKDETMKAQKKLSTAEVMLGNLQKENALLKDSESRLLKERESMKHDVSSQHLIQSNIELIKATLERTDAEGKIRLETKLDEAHLECSALRRRLQEEQDNFRELSNHLKKQTENSVERMEEEKKEADKLRKELTEVRETLINKSTQIEDLTKKLKMGMYTLPEGNTDGRKLRDLDQQLSDCQAEIESLKSKLKTAKETSEQHFKLAESAEEQVKLLLEQQEERNNEIENLNKNVRLLQEKCSELEGELSIRADDQDIANAGVQSKSMKLQEELGTQTMNLNTARKELDNCRTENRTLLESLKAVENKYAREVVLHSSDLQSLTNMKELLTNAIDDLETVKLERDQAIEAFEASKISWQAQEELFKKEKVELEQRFKDMDSQNGLLLDQIQSFNTQLSILQAQATEQHNQSGAGDISMNRSFAEDEMKSSEQLLKVIKYLRQEKDICGSKCEILEAEHLRVKSQLDSLTKQYIEAKAILDSDQEKSEVAVVTAAKHAEVLRKVETLNAITDSNRALREERNTLITQLEEFKSQVERLEKELAPLQEKNKELSMKVESLSSENISFKAECGRWRQRATVLIEKSNRTSPEDWKRLQSERENLAKQLTIERSTTTKLNHDVSSLQQDKTKLEEQLKSLRTQINNQSEEISRLQGEVNSLKTQVSELTEAQQESEETIKKTTEENRALTENLSSRDTANAELKNNLAAIRKIAKKYKIKCDELEKEIEVLKEEAQKKEEEQMANEENNRLQPEERTQLEEQINELKQLNSELIEKVQTQETKSNAEKESMKKEYDTVKQASSEKEERFKNLFKNAKDRIVKLTEENNNLKEELEKCRNNLSIAGPSSGEISTAGSNSELLTKIEELQKERDSIVAERQQEKEKHTQYVDTLAQRITQLQRQCGFQQVSKPSTSSGSTEKPASEPPTANIKPMAGHSTSHSSNAQSVTIQPWRSGGDTPLASIRPMSAQIRTVAVLPTSQSPSAVMVPPQQQVHTTGSSSIEALSSSPTSSHTDYVPATSSASSMMGPRQVAVPPTQSSQDNEDDESNIQVQNTPQQQTVALVLPRVEPPTSGPTQEQGTSSSSSNTVTTSQGSSKRPRDVDTESSQDEDNKTQQQPKRTRMQQAGTVSDSGLDVEYQVPTSSQRDHEDDSVVVLDSDDEGGADEGEGADDEPDDPDTEGYDETMEQDNYEDADCQDEEDEEGGNEVEVIEDSSEIPNQSERSEQDLSQPETGEQQQSEAISSGTDGSTSGLVISQASTSVSMTMPSRTRPVAPLPSRPLQSHLLLSHGVDEGDDGIVPSTPTLFVPRRSDGFGEAVSSPHVPTSGRFTFSESIPHNSAGSSEVVPEQTLEVSNFDDNSTGRSVPSTPLHTSPQESLPNVEEQTSHQSMQSDAEIPTIMVSGAEDEPPVEGTSEDGMGPPNVAGTSSEGTQPLEQLEDMAEGDDEVSSEGEKPPATEESEEEGREAEASPSTNGRRNFRGSTASRRSIRQMNPRSSHSRSGPTPIVWADQRNQSHRQDGQRGRANTNFPRDNRSPRRGPRSRGVPSRYSRY